MAYSNGPPTIVTNGLVMYVDTVNPRSYISGSPSITDVVSGRIATISGSVPDTVTLKNTPLVTTASSLTVGGLNFPLSSSAPDIYFDSRASRFTLSVWASVQKVDVSAAGDTRQTVFGRGSFGGYVGINVTQATTASAANLAVATRAGSIVSVTIKSSIQTGSVTAAEIFNAVLVYDSSSILGYFNGNLIGSASVLALGDAPFTGSRYFCNGRGGSGGNSNAATMSIYNASVYNRALSAQEVSQNFNAMRGRFGV